MRQAEIEFCKCWLTVSSDGHADARALFAYLDEHEVEPQPSLVIRRAYPTHRHGGDGAQGYFDLTPRGADLVASYEAALAQGLEIVADEDRAEAEELERSIAEILDSIPARPPCPECKGEGTIGITLEYGASGGIVRVWPATCPTCKGSKVAPAVIESTAHGTDDRDRIMPGLIEPTVVDADGWRALNHAVAREFVGETVEIRYRGESHGEAEVTSCDGDGDGFYSATLGGTVYFNTGYEVRRVNPWITEPEAMRELLCEKCKIEAKWVGGEDLGITRAVASKGLDRDLDARVIVETDEGPNLFYFGFPPHAPDHGFPILTAVRRVLP